jgi:hypothetical protein
MSLLTFRDWLLLAIGFAAILFGVAVSGGAFGPSDLELRIRASEPVRLP